MGLDVRIVMCKNKRQPREEGFWNICKNGWPRDQDGVIDFTQPSEVYYARKFWDLYTPVARSLNIDNCEYSDPLTKENLEFILYITTHNRDYFGNFSTVPAVCEILDHYDEATEAGMVFLFEGDY